MHFDIGPAERTDARRFTIYLPDRDKEGNPIPNVEYWLDEACLILCQINGGATRLAAAQGMWLENGNLVRETTHIVYSLIKPQSFFRQLGVIRAFVERFGRETNQDAVAVEFANRMYLIKPLPVRASA